MSKLVRGDEKQEEAYIQPLRMGKFMCLRTAVVSVPAVITELVSVYRSKRSVRGRQNQRLRAKLTFGFLTYPPQTEPLLIELLDALVTVPLVLIPIIASIAVKVNQFFNETVDLESLVSEFLQNERWFDKVPGEIARKTAGDNIGRLVTLQQLSVYGSSEYGNVWDKKKWTYCQVPKVSFQRLDYTWHL